MTRVLYTLLLALFPILSFAQDLPGFSGIAMNATLESVLEVVTTQSQEIAKVTITQPHLPMAEAQETHLVCQNVKAEGGVLDKVVFTFADNRLTYVEARGNAADVFPEAATDSVRPYMNYDVYFADKLFIHEEQDAAWILSDAALHANLFTWENPFLKHPELTDYPPIEDTAIPAFLTMGASLESMTPLMEKYSEFTFKETLDGSDPNAQVQVNCFGVDYMGFPRKAEARFGDDTLNVVWILTGKGEEERIREALISQFGAPVYTNDDWEIYNDWRVGLRKDKPEVLLMKQSIGLGYKETYFKQ